MATSLIRAGIIGAAGYTGGELIRLLLQHPQVDLVFAQSGSQANKLLTSVHTDLLGETNLLFTGEWDPTVDVLFLCMGHGQARQWLMNNPMPETLRVIDLSNDFRLSKDAAQTELHRDFVYGLPEFQREKIGQARSIANPGCFATAIQLSLLPLAAEGILQYAHVSGITGSTGAGQALQDTVHFSWRSNNVQSYKVLNHQHVGEVEETLRANSPAAGIWFVPYRGDFTRGIYTTAYTACSMNLETARALYDDYYADHPFTVVSDNPIDLKQVVNTNKCLLYLEYRSGHLIVHAAIDNLLKGASGQAVQNMNLMFGLEETAGLHLKPSAF